MSVLPGFSVISGGFKSFFPSVVEVVSTATPSGTTHSILLPVAPDIGDLLLGIIGSTDTTLDTPSGWDLIFNVLQSSGASTSRPRQIAIARVVTGEEGFAVNVTAGDTSKAAAHVIRIKRHASAGFGLGTFSDSGAANPPSVTAPWGSANNLFIATATVRNRPTITGAPANYTDLDTIGTSGTASSDVRTAIAFRELAAASDNPGTFTQGGTEQWVAGAIAIRPGL